MSPMSRPTTSPKDSSYGRHVGRVGALAVALGIGAAMATGQGLGIAHADEPDSANSSVSDPAGTPSGETPASSTETATDTTSSANTSASDHPSEPASDAPSDATPPMKLSSTGGADTSTNDAGQHTDTTPSTSVPTPTATGTPTAPPPAPSPTGDSEAVPPTASTGTATTPDDPPSEHTAVSNPSNDGEHSSTVPDDNAHTLQGISATPDTSPRAVASRAAFVEPATLALPAAPPPASDPVAERLSLPGRLVGATTTFVAALLAPFLAPGPTVPSQPPLLWAVLAWVRQEFGRAFANKRPDAQPDGVTTSEDVAVDIDVLANDGDADDPGAVSVVDYTRPAHGSLELNDDGSFTYTPAPDFHGVDTFTYTISDDAAAPHVHGLLGLLFGGGHTRTAEVSITVADVDDDPHAVDDTVEIDEDTTASGNVLTNDTDEDTPILAAALGTAPAHGTAVVGQDGSFTYVPNLDFAGMDSFTYTVTDGTSTDTATVTVTVRPLPDAPVARADAATVDERQSVTIDVLANDTDPDVGEGRTVTIGTPPDNGTVVVTSGNTVVYTPNPGFAGTDRFGYVVVDAARLTASATVTVTVVDVPDAPTASDDAYDATEDTPLSVDVGGLLANDTDADGDTLQISGHTPPGHGQLTLQDDGSFTYTPDDDFHGVDTFTYTITDGTGTTTSTATVRITVAATPDVPVANSDGYGTDEDTPLTVTEGVLHNDTDGDGDDLTVTTTGIRPTTAGGTVDINPDGTFTYTPRANFNGTDTFTYTVTDSTGLTTTGTVTIDVASVNDDPAPNPDTYTTAEDTPLTTTTHPNSLLFNDFDADDQALTVTSTGIRPTTAGGTVLIRPDGTFAYTPKENFNGTDTFTYTVTDGFGGTATQTATITVTAVPDAPVARNDTMTVYAGEPTVVDLSQYVSDPEGDSLRVTFVIARIGQDGSLIAIGFYDDVAAPFPTHVVNGPVTIDMPAGVRDAHRFTYTHTSPAVETIEYTVTDGQLESNGVITVNVITRPTSS